MKKYLIIVLSILSFAQTEASILNKLRVLLFGTSRSIATCKGLAVKGQTNSSDNLLSDQQKKLKITNTSLLACNENIIEDMQLPLQMPIRSFDEIENKKQFEINKNQLEKLDKKIIHECFKKIAANILNDALSLKNANPHLEKEEFTKQLTESEQEKFSKKCQKNENKSFYNCSTSLKDEKDEIF